MQTQTLPDPWQVAGNATRNNANNRRMATIEESDAGRTCDHCLRFHREGGKCLLANVAVKRNWTCDAVDPEGVPCRSK
jgi:MoaA/NifB/PqqE/SkfB family radical SAM enzyme